jgi:AraC family transcriptional regulator, transcriptional activator of pobA
MEKIETIEELYKRKFDSVPDNLKKEVGHINIFRLESGIPENQQPHTYIKRDFFKISLVTGESTIFFADKIINIDKQAIVFSNPFIPYQWQNVEKLTSGIFCIFNEAFFINFGNINQYNIFQPSGTHLFNLDDEQFKFIDDVFLKIEVLPILWTIEWFV